MIREEWSGSGYVNGIGGGKREEIYSADGLEIRTGYGGDESRMEIFREGES